MRRIAGAVVAAPASLLLGLTMAALPGGAASCTSEVTVPGGGGASASNAGSGASGANGPGMQSSQTPVAVYGTGPIGTTTSAGCDTGQQATFESSECALCIDCTRNMGCEVEWSLCTAGQPCGDFIACIDDCETQCGNDTMCYDSCVGVDTETSTCVATSGCMGANAAGCTDYITALSCSVCQFCPNNCDAAGNCSG